MNKLKMLLKKLIHNTAENHDESLRSKFIYGIFWNLISAMASQGFPMVAAIIAARLLGTYGYGQFSMINSTVIFFSAFAGLSLGITATKYIAEFYQTDPGKVGRIIGITNLFGLFSGSLMFVILFVIAPWLAANLLAAPDLTSALRIASLLLIFNTLVGVQSGSIAGFGAFKSMARIAVVQGIISASLTITGIYLFGLIGAVTAMVINSIINLILYRITIMRLVKSFGIKIEYFKSWSEKNILWKLSLPTMLASVMVGPVMWVANIIIISTAGGYDQLGIFNAANQWRTALSFLPVVIGGVLLPMISTNIHEENKALETVNVLLSWILVIIIALPLISFPEIIAFFYGPQYSSNEFLQSIALILLVSCMVSYKEGIGRKLVVKELVWWGFLSNILWAVILIGSVLIFKNLGSIGLAFSYVIAYGLNTLVFVPFYISRKVVPRDLIISKEVLLVWLVLIFQTLITIFHMSLWIKLFSLVISTIIITLNFYSILKKNNLIQ